MKERIQYYEQEDVLRIIIAAKKRWLVLLFMFIWGIPWTFIGLIIMMGLLFGEVPASITVRIGMPLGWLLGECWVLFIICWSFRGKEVIEISNGFLYIKKKLFYYTPSKNYLLSEVLNIKAEENSNIFLDYNFLGMGSTSISFTYEDKSIRFGLQLSRDESRTVIGKIQTYL